MQSLTVYFKGKKKEIQVRRAYFFGKIRGLMFRSRKTNNLLFSFNKQTRISLHSWFVFFPFLVLWLDEKDRVIESRIVHPFSTAITPSKPFFKVVEVPFSRRNKDIIRFFVGNKKI